MSSSSLYHYCKLSTALEYILPAKQLRLSPLINTNDPRENQSYVFGSLTENSNRFPVTEIDHRNKEATEILRADCKLICFSENRKYYGYESSRMWAYYGMAHKGLCLELDKAKFIEENSGIIKKDLLKPVTYFEFNYKWEGHKKVDYTIADSKGLTEYLRTDFRNEHLEFLYFTKLKEWESENEVRLIHFSEKEEEEYCTITDSLKKIYCGVDFHKSYLPSIAALCPGIDIIKLRYNDVRLIDDWKYSVPKNTSKS